jgi:tRNA dimethylallyltransferase
VYRELSIGTAVPDQTQLARVRHHLLQHRSVEEYYSAALFEEEALMILEKLFGRFDLMVVTGGSGLYLQAICEGIDDVPRSDEEVRQNLTRRLEKEGIESLRFELKRLDPEAYASLDLKNPKRVLRALEVCLDSGRPYSHFLTREKKARNFRVIKVGLRLEREELYDRINRRVDRMMESGLLEEARRVARYRHLNALNTVGYKELFDHLDGKHSLNEAVRLIKRNTRHYARRQMTWFKKDQEIQWFSPHEKEEILKFVRDVTGQPD